MKNGYNRYLKTYNGRKLFETHDLETEGMWQVYGEDPNCDWGGPHYEPRLGVYTGKLIDVLHEVTEMKGFWNWGSGGRLELITPIKVTQDSIIRQNKLKAEREALLAKLDILNKELGL